MSLKYLPTKKINKTCHSLFKLCYINNSKFYAPKIICGCTSITQLFINAQIVPFIVFKLCKIIHIQKASMLT